jgi:outer membrane protein
MNFRFVLLVPLFSLSIALPLLAQSGGTSLTLADAIDRALTSGARTAAAEASATASAASANRLASPYLPRVTVSAAVLASEHSQTITPIREPGVFPDLDRTIYDATLDVSWMVFDFGRGNAARQVARAAAEAAGIRYDLARMETIESVTSLYVRIAHLSALYEAERTRIKALREHERQVKLLHEEGRVSRADVLRLEEAVLEAETDFLATSNDRETVFGRLGAELAFPQRLQIDDVVVNDLPLQTAFTATSSASMSPQVAVATAQLRASEAALRESGRAFLPAAELFATERLRSGSEFSFDSDLTGGFRLRIPLFDGSKHVQREVRRAEVAERHASLDIARQEVEMATDDLLRRIDESHRRSDAVSRRQAHLEETYRIDRAAYDEGRLTLTDLLTTESRLAGARVEHIGARAASLLYYLQLEVLAGTLTPERATNLLGGQE